MQSKRFINNIGENKKLDLPNHLTNIKPESKNLQTNKDIGNKRALLWVIIKTINNYKINFSREKVTQQSKNGKHLQLELKMKQNF